MSKDKYIEQLRWERDTAIQQLNELGYGFGEKIRTDIDTISRRASIDAICDYPEDLFNQITAIEDLPSAQPEITDEQAIEHLQSTGWMQNHDREMYDMGFKEQLADDSGSYDSLLPPAQSETMYYPQVDGVTPSVIAQPERKKGRWIYGENDGQDGWYCSECGGFVPWDYDYYGLDNIDFIKDFKTCPRCDVRMISYTGMEEGEQE